VDLQKDVVFGVKTTAKFHDDRVVATRRTWAQDFDVTFYSDLEKGTDIVDVGVNTEKGHCAKLFAILQRLPDRGSFVALGDDDTFWNTTRLQQVLTWYDPAEPMAIGERYGYSRYANRGYDYLTSGSGMVFTQTALSRFRKCAEDGHCSCPQADTYDDMMLGRWLNSADVPAVHEVGFHQRRPFDYHPTYLQLEGPAVSFHSVFGQRTDPDRLYAEYLAPAGSKVPSPKNAEL
jgi:UDP-glucose:O-linked fucose beta-1,3-glucosyltransferase